MSKISINNRKIIYISLFVILNLINFELINTTLYMDIELLPRSFGMVLNCLFGNLGFVFLFMGLGILIFKKDYSYMHYLLILTILFCLFMIVISIYYNYYNNSFPSFYSFDAFTGGDTGDTITFMVKAVGDILGKAQYLFFLPLLFMILLFIFFFKRYVKKDQNIKKEKTFTTKKRMIIGFPLFVFGILSMFTSITVYNNSIVDTEFDNIHLINRGVQSTGIANYYVYEGLLCAFEKNQKYDENEINKLKNELDECNISLSDNQYTNIFKDKNLLMIQIESLANYDIGLQIEIDGEMKEVTPFLNSLVKKGAYFNNYHTTVGIGNTSDAEFSVLTGMYPNGYSFSIYDNDDVSFETIATLFNDLGYYTMSAHANTGKFYNRKEVHENVFGFDLHIDEEYLKEAGVFNEETLIHTWINDEELLNYLIDSMKTKTDEGENVFAFGITISCHNPFKLSELNSENKFEEIETLYAGRNRLFPEDYDGPFNGENMRYLEHVAYSDYALSQSLKNLPEDTIVILYGDHGPVLNMYEVFNENPESYKNDIHNIPYVSDSEYIYLNSFMTNVPLFIYDPSDENLFNNTFTDEITKGVRSHVNLKATVSNMFALNPKYIFNNDVFSSSYIYTYNPRNLLMTVDNGFISPLSSKIIYTNDEVVGLIDVDKYVKDFWKYKSFNDRALKYKLFNYLN